MLEIYVIEFNAVWLIGEDDGINRRLKEGGDVFDRQIRSFDLDVMILSKIFLVKCKHLIESL